MKKILIIEDDYILRENTYEFLTAENFDAYIAEDGITGVQTALEIIPDLILCDISMPKMDGYEVFKTLQNIPVTSQIPFIFLTAKAQKEEFRFGMQLGVDDYITKPYSFDDLLVSINTRLKKYERIYQQIENNYITLIENPLIGVFILQNDKFHYLNQSFAKMLGYNNGAEIYKRKFLELIYKEDETKVSEKLMQCTGGIYNPGIFKLRILDKKNNPIAVNAFFTLYKIRNEINILGYTVKEEGLVKNVINDQYVFDEITQTLQVLISEKNISPNELIKIIRKKSEQIEFLNPDDLTKREIEIIKLIATGLSNKEIADKLFISQRTVDSHKANILIKTGSKHTGALIMYAIKNNIILL